MQDLRNQPRKTLLAYSTWALVIFMLVLNYFTPSVATAQEPRGWSPRERIAGTHDEATTPYLVVDGEGTVHTFHSQPMSEDINDLGIIYSKWTTTEGWTEPIDIMLSPFRKQIYIEGAFLDQNNIIHIIFWSGDEREARIYYSQAPAQLAGRAPAWSKPEIIGEEAIHPHHATLAGDNQGGLYVVYSGNVEGKGLYFVNSRDSGQTWSDTLPIYFTYDDQLHPWALVNHFDNKGRMHIVWTVNNGGGTGDAVLYARYETARMLWSEPVILAEALGYEADWASLISLKEKDKDDELFVVYNNNQPPKRWIRRSLDGGDTWLDPEEFLPPTRGEYGVTAFAYDSNDVLHAIFSDRGRSLTLWHTTWRDGRWQEPEPMVSLEDAKIYQEGPNTFHPQRPRIAMIQGNTLLVTWQTDRGHDRNGTWYTFKQFEAPELPIEPLPTLSPTPTPTPTVTPEAPPFPTPTPTPRVTSDLSQNRDASSLASNPALPMMYGIGSVAAMIVVIVMWFGFINQRRG